MAMDLLMVARDLLITIPLRRLLILDDNNFLNHWISCGELVEDSDCEEVRKQSVQCCNVIPVISDAVELTFRGQ
jgi:hypothetical protein